MANISLRGVPLRVFHLKAGSFVHLRFTGAAHKINGNCSAQCTRQSKAIQASKQAGAGGDRGIKKLTKSRTASGKPGTTSCPDFKAFHVIVACPTSACDCLQLELSMNGQED